MRETWAIFNDDRTCRVGGYTSEKDAEEDMWCRPEGCFVDRVCDCVDALDQRPVGECFECPVEDDDDE